MTGASRPGPVLQLSAISKHYQGVAALEQVDLEAHAGEVHALLGGNGAGKSTLAKIIAGALRPSSGSLRIDDVDRQFRSPADSLGAGIAMVYQDGSLIPTLSIAANLKLGRERWLSRRAAIEDEAQQLLRAIGCELDPRLRVDALDRAGRRLVEITRAIARGARVVVLDEPSAELAPAERVALRRALAALRARGVAVLLISHAIDEALADCERITVLKQGRCIGSGTAASRSHAEWRRLLVAADAPTPKLPTLPAGGLPGLPLLSVEAVALGPRLHAMSFTVKAGEVLGILGLAGSGATDVARLIAGASGSGWRGAMRLQGRPFRPRSSRAAVRAGVACVTGDRQREGGFDTMSAEDNIYLGALAAAHGWRFRYSPASRRRIAGDWLERLAIVALDPGLALGAYSGGNRQKLVVAKTLAQQPTLVVFDEPTRGVDLNAVPLIRKAIRGLAGAGGAAIVVSSDAAELLAVADRILLARSGRIVDACDARRTSAEAIMARLLD